MAYLLIKALPGHCVSVSGASAPSSRQRRDPGSAGTAQPRRSALLRHRVCSLQPVAVLHRGQDCTMLRYKL